MKLLKERHFREFADHSEKVQYLIVSAYNVGLGRVKMILCGKKINSQGNDKLDACKKRIRKMSSNKLLTLLQKRLPEDTKKYLENVSSKMRNYHLII